jgi:hypothetical protein
LRSFAGIFHGRACSVFRVFTRHQVGKNLVNVVVKTARPFLSNPPHLCHDRILIHKPTLHSVPRACKPGYARIVAHESHESREPDVRGQKADVRNFASIRVFRGRLSQSGSVIGDGFGYIERRIFASHIVGAHFAFRDDAGDGGFKTRGHFGFLEPVEH